MSIYTCKGFETNKLIKVESETDDFQTIVNSKVVAFTDKTAIELIKRTQAYYFIAGELSEPVRKNDNVLKKSLVAIDYDSLELSEKEFQTHLKSKIGVLNYYAYPSIRHGIAGTRYRLIIKTDRPFTKEENAPLIKFITDQIALPYDSASDTWSQLQSLKMTFESVESFEEKCIYNKGIGVLKVDNALKKQSEKQQKKPKEKSFYQVNYKRSKTFTASFIEELLTGAEEGNRNAFLTSKTGKCLSLGMTPEATYTLIHLINSHFIEPSLPDREVDIIFSSILKRDTEKLSKGGGA